MRSPFNRLAALVSPQVELARFLGSWRVGQVACGPATAALYALIYAALAKPKLTIPTNDLGIAASCLEHGVALLTLSQRRAEQPHDRRYSRTQFTPDFGE